MSSDAVQDVSRKSSAGPVRGGLSALHGEASQHPSHGRVHGTRVDCDAGMGGDAEPGGMTGDHEKEVEPERLLDPQ
eukprot:5990284-Lingulodinium_polyedra.AAC.1